MRINTLLKTFLVSLVGSVLLATTVQAAINIPNVSNFTPVNRAIKAYVLGIQGLPYPSFNNFTNNPNIPGAFENDERKFTVGRQCAGGQANCGDSGTYFNTIPTLVKAGDVVRFSVYFHNNGDDPNDGDDTTSPDAKNVKIGIDLNNIQNAQEALLQRPVGFIEATNNEYRTNFTDASTVIKSGNNIVRKATDDMGVVMFDEGLFLEPLSGSAKAQFKNLQGQPAGQNVTTKVPNTTDFTFVTEDGGTVTVKGTPHFEGKKMWIEFDKLPGCFRYSGFVFLDAIVKETPKVCTELNMPLANHLSTSQAKALIGESNVFDMWEFNVEEVDFEPGAVPTGVKVKFTSDDPNGKFFDSNGDLIPGGNSVEIPYEPDTKVYYRGNGPNVDVKVVGAPDKTCEKHFKIETPKNVCEEIIADDLTNLSKSQAESLINQEDVTNMWKININEVQYGLGVVPEGTKLKFTTSDPQGEFWLEAANSGSPWYWGNSATIDVADLPLWEVYYIGDGPATITVDVLDKNGKPLGLPCQITFEIPEEVCKEILIDHPETVYVDTTSEFTSGSLGEDGQEFEEDVTYTVEDGYGFFYTEPPVGPPDNPSADVKEIPVGNPFAYMMYFTDTDTPEESVFEFIINSMDDEEDEEDNSDANFFKIPNLPVSTEIKNQEKAMGETKDLKLPEWFGKPFKEPSKAPEKMPGGGGSNFGINLFDLNLFPEAEAAAPAGGKTTITVPAGTKVYFVGTQPGEDKIHVTTEGTDVEDCSRDFDIELLPKNSVCENLTYKIYDYSPITSVDQPTTLEENNLYRIHSTPEFTDPNDPDKNKVTYTIDPAYGTFVNVKPQNNIWQPVINGLNSLILANNVTPASVAAIMPFPNMLSSTAQITDANVPLILIIYTNTPGSKAGVLKIQATNETDPDCTKLVDIVVTPPPENVCVDLTYVLTLQGTATTAPNLERNKFYELVADTNFSQGGIHKVTYTIDADYGTFVDSTDAAKINEIKALIAAKNVSLQSLQTVFGANAPAVLNQTTTKDENVKVLLVTFTNTPGGITKVLNMAAVGSSNLDCADSIDFVVPVINECVDLTYVLTLQGTQTVIPNLERNKFYEVVADVQFSQPGVNQVTYLMDLSYGTFIETTDVAKLNEVKALIAANNVSLASLQTVFGVNAPAVLKSFVIKNEGEKVVFVTYTNTPGAKTGVLSMTNTVLNFNVIPDCIKKVDLVVPPAPTECVNLFLTPNSANFNPNNSATLFEIGGDYKGHNQNIEVTTTCGSVTRLSDPFGVGKTITFTPAEFKAPAGNLQFQYKRTNDCDPSKNAVKIGVKATGTAAGVCEAEVGKNPPPPQENICLDLDIIEPDSPWEADEDDDRQAFQIDVDTDPTSYQDDIYYNWKFSNEGDNTHWNSEDEDEELITERGETSQILRDFEDGTLVEVWATKSSNSNDTFKNNNGDQICRDYIRVDIDKEKPRERDRTPDISKYVYAKNDIKKRDDIINVNASTDYVTFMVVLKTGENINSIAFRDTSMRNGKIKGSEGSELIYKAMQISYLEDNKNTGVTIFEDGNYIEDRGNNTDTYHDDNFKAFSNLTKSICGKNDKDFCVGSESTLKNSFAKNEAEGDIVKQFRNGYDEDNQIFFHNVKKLDSDSAIVIKYQMTYPEQFRLDDEACKKMSGRCGEQFKNNAEFEADSDKDDSRNDDDEDCDEDETDEDDKDYCDDNDTSFDVDFDGDDQAKVVAICPYVLTRQGGDTFFHDVLDIGIDVSQCSEVKNAPVIITPERFRTTEVTRTGEGDLPDEIIGLDIPSHDVCRYSNLKTNIEGYNDVLKNFSSTICELRAEVADIWTKKNINEAISANVERISRWGQNLGGISTISNTTNYSSIKNSKSGIFVKTEGDLIIGANASTFTVKSGTNVPAAQTYIVKGHDLIINSNIEYAKLGDLGDAKNISSAAFIVIDGNIIINPNVTRIDGILMAVDTDEKGDDGKVINGTKLNGKATSADSPTQLLVINGNLIGDVYDLFKNRKAVGDPRKEEGSVTIRYDQRILLNTPPGISELVDLEQAIIP
ncbi:MAG: hypothetical protein AAB373_03675 [Patescibacteria group bacterium]